MKFLQQALNDNTAHTCNRCSNCQKKGFTADVLPELVIEAEDFLKECTITIKPKEKAPVGLFESGKKIPQNYRNAPGQSLSYYGDVGWGKMVKSGKYQLNHYSDDLVEASAHLILNRWKPNPFPQWVTCIPSKKHPTLVSDLTRRLAEILGIPYLPVLDRTTDAPQQKTMQNELKQAKNVIDSLTINGKILNKPVLLVDDIIDSGWTLAIAGYLLRMNGSGIVYPFTIAQASGRNSSK
jgi:ATP-dependent DNA helicase RecQ